jgi:nitroimidazol reductase NimA-like FMN-containing flavoprotein (pyridoxamine 5'-phosphate oxidase superfamily)
VTEEHAARARAIVDANAYMVLATADREGRPWASPVWFAPHEYREFFWVSSPDARHSRNIDGRGEVAVVIFDSQAPVGSGQGVYLSAVAEEVAGGARADGIEIFSRRSLEQGAREWTLAEVEGPAPLRLYRATAREAFLGERDRRLPVTM